MFVRTDVLVKEAAKMKSNSMSCSVLPKWPWKKRFIDFPCDALDHQVQGILYLSKYFVLSKSYPTKKQSPADPPLPT